MQESRAANLFHPCLVGLADWRLSEETSVHLTEVTRRGVGPDGDQHPRNSTKP